MRHFRDYTFLTAFLIMGCNSTKAAPLPLPAPPIEAPEVFEDDAGLGLGALVDEALSHATDKLDKPHTFPHKSRFDHSKKVGKGVLPTLPLPKSKVWVCSLPEESALGTKVSKCELR